MQPKPTHPAIRTLFAVGLLTMVLGGCVAGCADGFGDSPSPVHQSRRDKMIGAVAIFAGAATSIGAAIALYLRDRRREK